MVKKHLKLISFIFISFSTVILSACASSPKTKLIPLPDPSTVNIQTAWKANQDIISQVKTWQASGVIGIKVKNKGSGASLFWQVKGKHQYVVKIFGAAGLGAISITGRADGSVIFKNSNGKETYAKDIQALMQKELGWSVPTDGLFYWGRGLPEPIHSKQKSLNTYGLLNSIEQSGWHVQYQEYTLVDDQYPLPSKMTLTRGDITLKVVIKSWQLN
ncbi:lipoprotein insertase outer membrane protein LolB [Thiotrichales bacterium 19S9-12]|nr:lipoprotein insertase outer membrane protein LolB [Thiotrichales bacterium 19S9-11]MCF6811404.1 lipoprotein insertase outer membrane protein LolB [Thiotrichales bacterium 19S9-12]